MGKRDWAASTAELHLIFSAFSELKLTKLWKGWGKERESTAVQTYEMLGSLLVKNIGQAKCQGCPINFSAADSCKKRCKKSIVLCMIPHGPILL